MVAIKEDKEDAPYYLAKCMALAKKSKEYTTVLKVVMDVNSAMESKILTMFSIGIMVGGICTLAALNEGFIDGGDIEEPDFL